jgi:hypothetical protein
MLKNTLSNFKTNNTYLYDDIYKIINALSNNINLSKGDKIKYND